MSLHCETVRVRERNQVNIGMVFPYVGEGFDCNEELPGIRFHTGVGLHCLKELISKNNVIRNTSWNIVGRSNVFFLADIHFHYQTLDECSLLNG